jgi:DNA-binding transcriptional ArsR family regulator
MATPALTRLSDISDPRIAKALTHPLRIQILNALDGDTASPSDLAAKFDAPLGNVSYHVRTLADLGLLKLVKRRTRRGAVEHYYTATSRANMKPGSWKGVPGAVKDAVVGSSLEQIGTQAFAAAQVGGFQEGVLARSTYPLDDEGRAAVAEIVQGAIEQVEEAARQAAERQDGNDENGVTPTTVVTMLFSNG